MESQSSLNPIEKTKTLICALNLLSRNLPLPPHLFHAVSYIYHAPAGDDDGVSGHAHDGAGGPDLKGAENVSVLVSISLSFF